jgi:hypothetical protein
MTARRLFVFAFAAALLAGFGCSNDDSGGGSTGPALSCTDGGNAAANGVNTNCAGAVDSETELVDIVIGGPAAGTTSLRGVNLDLTFDDTKLAFVPSTPSFTSPLFPTALIAVSSPVASGRVIVSIQQPGSDPAVTVGPGQHVVMSLMFKRAPAATFTPTPIGIENTDATGASAPISFASATMIAYQ